MTNIFWADKIATQIIERSGREKRTPNIKCQQTPSGAKHIGNLNDVVRAYFPYKSVVERGTKCTFVHTTDDRDPLKDIPKKLADLDEKWHPKEELPAMEKYLGMPLCRIPDPFGCCASWSRHFTQVWMDGVYALGMQPKLFSLDDLYRQGKFEPYIKMVFEKKEETGRLVAKFQKTKGESYIPFDAICPKCGLLANASSFDMKAKTVSFVCGGKSIKKKKAEGCGYKGEVPIAEGKLQWRFEWPALWAMFHITYEPFGKDHAEGSWPSGQEIARSIFGIEPPIPFVYEFFLVNGQKMSASVGNVYIVQDMLSIVEPEVFMFFYTKRPGMQRNLDLSHIYQIVDDFERAERVYFGKEEEKNITDRENLNRSYEMCFKATPKRLPVRIPYQFAALIGQTGDIERALKLLKFTGHARKVSASDKERIRKRLMLATNWARLYAAPEARITLNKEPPEMDLKDNMRSALHSLANELKKELNEKELQSTIFDIARSHSIETKELFRTIYRLLINRDSGPRLGPFIISVGKERVRKMIEKVARS